MLFKSQRFKGVIEDVLASQQGAFERRNLKKQTPWKVVSNT